MPPEPMDAYRTGLAAIYHTRLPGTADAEFFDYSFANANGGPPTVVRVARIALPSKPEDRLWFFGTLSSLTPLGAAGHLHRHQFIGIYDSDDLALGEMLAGACEFDATIAQLDWSHTFPLAPKSVLQTYGYSSCVLLDPSMYWHFKEAIPAIVGTPTTLLVGIPIRTEELALKKEKGVDDLLSEWKRTGRHPMSVKRVPPQ